MNSKKFLSAFLSIVMVFSSMFVPVYADENTAASVTVTVAAQKDGGFLISPQKITVSDGIAEEYGYTVAEKNHNEETVDEPTLFDAMVAVHKEKYGDKFTEETSKDYLDIASSGYLTKAFGLDASASGFYINSKMPADENNWGYTAETAELKTNDMVEFWFYQDTTSWSDAYTCFDKTEITVGEGEAFDLTLSMMAYDVNSNAYLAAVDGTDSENNYITVNTVNDDGSIGAALTDEEENEIAPDKNGKITLSFDKSGVYIVTAQGFVNGYAPIVAPICTVTVEETPAPTSITIEHDAKNVIDGKLIVKKGDTFKLRAYDQNGSETPVTWKNSSYGGVAIDEATGEVEVTADVYSGSISYWYFTAVSDIDETVTKQITIQSTGYLLSTYQKNQTVALSADGQTAKTASVTAGYSGHNIWSYAIPDGVAELSADPSAGGSAKFNVYRPGTFNVTFKLDINEALTDTAAITVTGAAVEDSEGNSGKTYLSVDAENPNPTVQLTAYLEDGRTVSSWESSDEAVATVDENGLVTATGIGSAVITVTDSAGVKGGIKAVVSSEEVPYFESLEFAATAFNSGVWVKGETFSPTKLEYDLPIKNYSTSALTLQNTTLYDTERYTAVAEYTDVNGKKQSIAVNSGKTTSLANQPFDDSVLTITLSDKNNADKKSVYTFNVSRPRDTTKAIKNNGITLTPTGRDLSVTTYNGVSEGTMQKADENGVLTSGTGVSSSTGFYRAFVYNNAESFKLNLTSSTAYAHIRYSTDGGSVWSETVQGGGITDDIALPEDGAAEILIQIIDDAAYSANVKEGNDGFFAGEPAKYKLWVDKVELSETKLLTAQASGGDWYPQFSPDLYSYCIVVENNAETPVLTYTAAEGCTVKIGTTEQIPDENGNYTLTLGTTQTSITVTSADGSYASAYKFSYRKKSALDVPDKVTDYLCIGSQYTNVSYGINPEATLSGGLKSLGNFGGYITYYYEEPITDNPNNKYGMDFYVIGNSSETNIDSMAELGQVYVSEDGNTWYALAGSEHYENKAIWDYTITYTKGSDSKSYWTDNFGNSIDYAAKAWPSAANYYMNNVAGEDSYTFTGILFKSQLGSIMGDSSSTVSFASSAKLGYADYYASNVSAGTLADVNSYIENPSKANGFDLAWAVDANGLPIDVSDKEFHYIKVATASNIYAGAFAEKSTEVTYVVRTTAQESEVGKTAAPTGVTISDGVKSKTVAFTEGQQVYPVYLDDMKYVSVTVNGTADDDNIYINNQRVASANAAQGFKVTEENGETLVRVIVQNGDKEPVIYLLQLTSSAEESDELIEGIKINASGSIRDAATTDGVRYTASVGSRIGSIAISVVAAPDTAYTINGEKLLESYNLDYGDNTFEIRAENADGVSEAITLIVTRENAPSPSGSSITVYFTLYGDEEHGTSQVHTYKNDKNSLPVWISRKAYTVPAEYTVLDVFEQALTEADIEWINYGGNYISEINGLAEFDNGDLSGWMYFLNNVHPGLGVAEQTLKNGDSIIFHYTDDYTQEQGSEKWTSGGGSVTAYTVRFETNGAGAIQSQSININGTVTKPPVPSKEGYSFGGWFTDKELTSEYDFSSKVTRSFTLYAKWIEDTNTANNANNSLFSDVPVGAWYEEAVAYVTENNLFKGVSETEFAPDSDMTRAMFAAVLYRLENPTQAASKHSFEDVKDGEWYTDAISWAAENGVVKGMSDTIFAPNEKITREQMAAIMYRYAELKGYNTEKASELLQFTDRSEISGWALAAMQWANAAGLIQGTSDTTMSPKATATRAQVAAILMRFCKNIAE